MFKITTSKVDMASAERPKRTGRGGLPYLAVGVDSGRDPFLVPAHDGEGKSAEVNGVPVWDVEKNDWSEDWEVVAETASPIKSEPVEDEDDGLARIVVDVDMTEAAVGVVCEFLAAHPAVEEGVWDALVEKYDGEDEPGGDEE